MYKFRFLNQCKNTLFFLNKSLFLSLNLGLISDIFVLSKGIKRERPKTVSMSTTRADRQFFLNITALFFAVCSLMVAQELKGQGGEFSFGGPKDDQAKALVKTRDGGFLMVGFSESFGSDNDEDIYVIRTNFEGKLLWSKVYDADFEEQANDIIELEDGNFLIVGNSNKLGTQSNVHLLKISETGEELWSKNYGNDSFQERGEGIVPAVDGGYVIVGTTRETANGEEDILIIKVNEAGEELWTKTYGADQEDIGRAITVFENGYVIAGVTDNTSPGAFDKDIIIYRLDAAGELVWTEPKRFATPEKDEAYDVIATRDGNIVIVGSIFDNSNGYVIKMRGDGSVVWEQKGIDLNGLGDVANAVIELVDESLVVAGFSEPNADNINLMVAKLNSIGEIQWVSDLGRSTRTDWGEDVVMTSDGGFAVAGFTAIGSSSFITDALLVITDGEGNTTTNVIAGQVFFDKDSSCDLDPEDQPLKEWLVRVTGENETFFGTTDVNGRYRIQVDTGRYSVTVLPVNEYWESCIAGGYNINLTNFYDTTSLNFPVFIAQACPYLEVDISTPFLAVCSDIEYTVKYCNLGTAVASGAYVEVTLDDNLTYESSSVPFINQNGNTYRFLLGDLEIAECGSFTIQTKMACEGIAMGQAALVKAHIFPDVTCLEPGPNWDGSSVQVGGTCQQDSVIFTLRNIGRNGMSQPLNYYVVQDDIMFRQGEFSLGASEEQSVSIKNTGSTYRIIAEQSEDHPGRSYPTLAIEGCAENGQPTSTGYFGQFPEDDQDNFIDTDVQEVISSISEAEMRGYPKGYRDSIIDANTEITYKIFFLNTGTDTLTRVIIRDTLPEALDVTSIVPGPGSHPYRFEIYGKGILRIIFDNIQLLPDGGANETSNWGYVTFRISQKPNNTLGTTITNRATIYFDYEAPMQTNDVRHIVDEFPTFVEVIVSTDEDLFVPGVKINVRPNPFRESTTFEIEGRQFKEVNFSILDMTGRLIYTNKFYGNQYVYRNQLAPGTYFYKMESEGQLINSGKLLVR